MNNCMMTTVLSDWHDDVMPLWDEQSLNILEKTLKQAKYQNKPNRTFAPPTCGNTIMEQGEECDCGIEHACDDVNCVAKVSL